MLVLSRKLGEEILIGDHVRLVVHRIVGNRVSLGISAPKEVPVIRGELRSGGSPSRRTTARASRSPAV